MTTRRTNERDIDTVHLDRVDARRAKQTLTTKKPVRVYNTHLFPFPFLDFPLLAVGSTARNPTPSSNVTGANIPATAALAQESADLPEGFFFFSPGGTPTSARRHTNVSCCGGVGPFFFFVAPKEDVFFAAS